jgi:MFS family permease
VPPGARAFPWYLVGIGSWFASAGMQNIVFTWLLTVVLHEPPARVAVAHMSRMAPATFLRLVGGAVADRADGRRLLVRGHLVSALPPLVLGVAIARGGLTYGALIAYALAVGTAGAFVMPARDAMLTRVAPGGLGRAVAVMTAVQFAAQLVGIAVGGGAGAIGAPALLFLQAAVLASGGVAALRLPAAPPVLETAPRSRLGAMRDGLRAAAESPILAPVLIANLAVDVLYVGAFFVILPLIVRDAYGGGSAELSLLSLGFWGGTIGSTLVQIRLGALRRPGRAIVLALLLGAGVRAAMAWPGPCRALVALCVVWGLGAGVVMTQARTLVQAAAPETHRARILSLFQLGLMGGAPVGALLIGYVAGLSGPRAAVVYPAAGMLAVLAGLLLRSRLWQQGEAR